MGALPSLCSNPASRDGCFAWPVRVANIGRAAAQLNAGPIGHDIRG